MADESLFDSNDAQSLIALHACSQFNPKLRISPESIKAFGIYAQPRFKNE